MFLRHKTVSSDRGEKLPAASLPSGRCPESGAACFQGLCPVAMASVVNGTTTPTSQLQSLLLFVLFQRAHWGPRVRPSGQIMGGERRGQLGAKERRLQEWILQPALRTRCPPSTCMLGKLWDGCTHSGTRGAVYRTSYKKKEAGLELEEYLGEHVKNLYLQLHKSSVLLQWWFCIYYGTFTPTPLHSRKQNTVLFTPICLFI